MVQNRTAFQFSHNGLKHLYIGVHDAPANLDL
jgi:hypothetical protein